MKSRNLKQVKNSLLIHTIALTILILLSQCKHSYKVELMNGNGTIEGKIENYDGVFKSGKLSYFDAVSRIQQNEIFEIDSTGSFKVTFNIPHPIYNTSYLDLQENYYNLFLEPGKDLKIKITDNSIDYIGDNGLSNNQIILLEDTIYKKFQTEIEHCTMLHTTDIEYKDYLQEQFNLAKKKLEFINEFEKTHNINQSVLNAVKKDAYYAAAKSWICFRFDYSSGGPQERDTLFDNFYEDLFEAYPINDQNALVSVEYIDYISNIKSVFSKSGSYGTRIDFIRKSNLFSDKELYLIEGLYKIDTSITNSGEFKQFYNKDNKNILIELLRRNSFNNVLNSCKDMPKGIGRDLIVSQGLSCLYFKYSYIQPTAKEWEQIDELIDTEFIIDYLRNLDNSHKMNTSDIQAPKEIPESVKKSAKRLSNEIIRKYIGKVVYIDFWTTWCGPCRDEVPYSKVLMEQFKDEDVVFLFLCCQSNKQNWKNKIAHENLMGEHYLINNAEYRELSALYRVNAFPTYILINKKGEVVNYKAPRPRSKETIVNEINKLLE